MNVLSLFDGMRCGRIALDRAGIKVDNYLASEIDKYAIQVGDKNYPDTINLGDVTQWRSWNLPRIDLILAGSPCQGFSFAGKQLAFDDPRSKLFFTFIDIAEDVIKKNPKVKFLLENVKMKRSNQDIISKYMGCEPVLINSALVSAQNRNRNYWSNIPIEQPKDKGILLKDVVLPDALPIILQRHRGVNPGYVKFDKSPPMTSSRWEENHKVVVCGRVVGRARVLNKRIDHKQSIAGISTQELELRSDNKSNCLSTVQKDNVLLDVLKLSEKALAYMDRKVKDGRSHWDFKHHSDIRDEKSAAIVANFFKGVPYNVFKDWDCVRKFHPVECERLQTVPDNYTEGVSNTQRYKMLGNGWTVDVIAGILEGI